MVKIAFCEEMKIEQRPYYVPVFLSSWWLYHNIAFPFSGLITRLLLWQFCARLHFQPSRRSHA